MRREDRRTVAVTGYLHGLSHAAILSIPVFLAAWGEFTTDPAVLGLLAASAYACFGLSSLPFGYLADRGSPRPMLLLSAGGIAASLLLVAASPNLPVLALSLGALGLFAGIYHPTGLSLISRQVAESGRGFGWHGMGGSLGVALGPAAVGFLLAQGWSWRTVSAVLVVPSLLGFAAILVSAVGKAPRRPTEGNPPPRPRELLTVGMVLILLVYTFSGIAYWGSLTFLPRTVGTEAYVLLLAAGAVGQVLSGQIAERPRSERILFVLSLSAGGLLLLLATVSSNTSAAVAAVYGFLLFSLEPLQNTLVTRAVPWSRRGLAFGMTFLAVFGFGSVGSALGGFLVSAGLPSTLFIVLGGSLFASGACALLVGAFPREKD